MTARDEWRGRLEAVKGEVVGFIEDGLGRRMSDEEITALWQRHAIPKREDAA